MDTYQNITISMPGTVVSLLYKIIRKGERSKFIAEAVEEKLIERKLEKKYDFIEETKKIYKRFGGTITPEEAKRLIEKGRA